MGYLVLGSIHEDHTDQWKNEEYHSKNWRYMVGGNGNGYQGKAGGQISIFPRLYPEIDFR